MNDHLNLHPIEMAGTTSPGSAPGNDNSCCSGRRRLIMLTAVGMTTPLQGWARQPVEQVQIGDLLVDEDDEKAQPLRVDDLRVGKPVLVFPADPSGTVRNSSRLNKLLVLRFNPDDLPASLRERSADGVLAYSAICTHQFCDVKTWVAKDKLLVCYCHSSKFALLDDGRVAAGPASRALPWIPLKTVDGRLTIAGTFSAPPAGTT